jgi:hypothetical protein
VIGVFPIINSLNNSVVNQAMSVAEICQIYLTGSFMKRISITILFFLCSHLINAQGMFTKVGKFSLDAGVAYLNNGSESGMAYNLSTSIVGTIDIGADYYRAFSSDAYKRTEGGSGYVDFYMHKDSALGAVLNLAYSSYNYSGSFLVGISGYARIMNAIGQNINLFPYMSIGYLTFANVAFGIGFAIEKQLNNNFSVVVTPQVGSDGFAGQYGVSLELILK